MYARASTRRGSDPWSTPNRSVPATPDTCYWGYIDRDQPPCLEVDDGDIIRIVSAAK